jgi:hypothetical protein
VAALTWCWVLGLSPTTLSGAIEMATKSRPIRVPAIWEELVKKPWKGLTRHATPKAAMLSIRHGEASIAQLGESRWQVGSS